jgi:hypothetical protein
MVFKMLIGGALVELAKLEALGDAALEAGAAAGVLVSQGRNGRLASRPLGKASWPDGSGWLVSLMLSLLGDD